MTRSYLKFAFRQHTDLTGDRRHRFCGSAVTVVLDFLSRLGESMRWTPSTAPPIYSRALNEFNQY